MNARSSPISFQLSVESGVEDEVPTLAFPTHGLIVGVVVTSGVGNGTKDCWRVDVGSLHLGVCRHLDGFTVAAWVAPSLAFRWPWTDLSSHNRLVFTFRLSKLTKIKTPFINYNSTRSWRKRWQLIEGIYFSPGTIHLVWMRPLYLQPNNKQKISLQMALTANVSVFGNMHAVYLPSAINFRWIELENNRKRR